MDTAVRDRLQLALLNDWQRGFPLVAEPFAAIGARLGTDGGAVIDAYRALLDAGVVSRIGGVFGAGAGGAALLCAFAVPPSRLDAVAALVSAHPGVNHNYEREHRFNLWFVITGHGAAQVARAVDGLEAACGQRALRLPMRRAYRIDLGFDLTRALAGRGHAACAPAEPVAAADLPLAACVEGGLPLLPRPYDAWAATSGRSAAAVRATLQGWLDRGTLRRFGVVVRHHEVGFAHNAMTVFDVPDAEVDACGERLAAMAGVTLAYRRERGEGWPYNLYCMVHGRDRASVRAAIDDAAAGASLAGHPSAVLFSRRRFKQSGASYFRGEAAADVEGVAHVAA